MRLNKLEEAIKEQLSTDSTEELKQVLADVCRCGANAGFPGFCYSSELEEFYKDNKAEIISELKELASDLGVGFLEMVAGFNCLKGSDLTVDEIGEIIFGNSDHECRSMVIDALCWAVLENFAYRMDS